MASGPSRALAEDARGRVQGKGACVIEARRPGGAVLEIRRARGSAAWRFSPDTQEMAGNVYTLGVTSVLRGYSSYSLWTPRR